MSNSFGLYSQYYDLLYQDKDYRGEVDYVNLLLKEHSLTPATSLLELGSGTGIHASMIAAAGIGVTGVELSPEMLEAAKTRQSGSANTGGKLSFAQGDARTYRAGRTFDAVASLFHVLSYQTSDPDLTAMLETAAVHLKPGGIFIFDFWYGPSVLSQQPSTRVKRWSNDKVDIARLAEPVMHSEVNVVDVNYTIYVTDKATEQTSQVREKHEMRYLFLPELDRFLADAGFERVAAEEWMTRATPSTNTWGVCVVARKR